jgi:hypothetical protein
MNLSKTRQAAIVAAFMCLATTLGPALSQNGLVSTKGHWHADFARSTNPWGARPESVTLDIMVDDETRYEATETIVRYDGTTHREVIKATYDGRSYPVEGSPHHVTISLRRLPSGMRQIKLEAPGGFRAVILCGLSADRGAMTCDETDTAPDGVSRPARAVYVRD